jgi:hypothetical protein
LRIDAMPAAGAGQAGKVRRRRRRIPDPITIIPTLAGSGTFARLMPFAAAKASRAATSPAEAAPLTLWLKFAAKPETLVLFARASC